MLGQLTIHPQTLFDVVFIYLLATAMTTPLRRLRTMPLKTITRQELQEAGASIYHARRITDALTPATVKGRTKIYALQDVIAEIRVQLAKSQNQPPTRQVLQKLLSQLLQRLDNVIEAPFGKSPEEKMSFYVYRILGQSSTQDSSSSSESKTWD